MSDGGSAEVISSTCLPSKRRTSSAASSLSFVLFANCATTLLLTAPEHAKRPSSSAYTTKQDTTLRFFEYAVLILASTSARSLVLSGLSRSILRRRSMSSFRSRPKTISWNSPKRPKCARTRSSVTSWGRPYTLTV